MIHKRSSALERSIKIILLEGLNPFYGAQTSPLVQMWIKTQGCLVCMKHIHAPSPRTYTSRYKKEIKKDKDSTVNKTEYPSNRYPTGKHRLA